MTITQTVEIPADRRITIDIPREVNADKAHIMIRFPAKKTALPEANDKKIGMTRKELDELLKNAHTPISDSLTGILSDLGDITIEQIREERLAKHLQ
jgi:hypothetical protein